MGRELFEGDRLTGSNGRSCVECHDGGKPYPLRRSSLKRRADELGGLINICIVDSSRTAGQTLDMRSPEMRHLAAYIVLKYRLPSQALEQFHE